MLSQYQHALRITKGGLTISGGEPLMQHRFVLRLFGAAKEMGVHTALDSNGFLGERLSDADLAFHVIGEMGKRVPLAQPAFRRDVFIAAGE